MRTLLITLLLVLLAGCGEESPTTDPPQGGAESPQALVARLHEFPGERGVSDLVLLTRPREQSAVGYVYGALPLSLVPMTLSAAENVDEAEKRSILNRATAMLDRHGVRDLKSRMKAIDPDTSAEARLQMLRDALGDVDHVAFVGESWELLGRANALLGGGPMTGSESLEVFELIPETLDVEGNRATVASRRREAPFVLVKEPDGRWYLSFLDSKLLERE